MHNPRLWTKKSAARSALKRRAAQARWERAHANRPLRCERVVRITVEDFLRTRSVIVARQVEGDDGRWSRWRVDGMTCRPIGGSGLAVLVREALE